MSTLEIFREFQRNATIRYPARSESSFMQRSEFLPAARSCEVWWRRLRPTAKPQRDQLQCSVTTPMVQQFQVACPFTHSVHSLSCGERLPSSFFFTKGFSKMNQRDIFTFTFSFARKISFPQQRRLVKIP